MSRCSPAAIAMALVALQLHAQIAEATRQGQLTPDRQRTIDAAVDAAVTALRAHRPVDTTDLLHDAGHPDTLAPAVLEALHRFAGR